MPIGQRKAAKARRRPLRNLDIYTLPPDRLPLPIITAKNSRHPRQGVNGAVLPPPRALHPKRRGRVATRLRASCSTRTGHATLRLRAEGHLLLFLPIKKCLTPLAGVGVLLWHPPGRLADACRGRLLVGLWLIVVYGDLNLKSVSCAPRDQCVYPRR